MLGYEWREQQHTVILVPSPLASLSPPHLQHCLDPVGQVPAAATTPLLQGASSTPGQRQGPGERCQR